MKQNKSPEHFYYLKHFYYLFLQVVSYVAEISQPHLRGMLSSTGTMSVSIGSLLQFLLGTFLPWRQVTLFNSFVPVIALLLLTIIPESPLWLLQKKQGKRGQKKLSLVQRMVIRGKYLSRIS